MVDLSKHYEKSVFHLTRKLIEAGVCVSQNFPSSTKNREMTEISFSGNTNVSLALKNVPYTTLYRELLISKQYNMHLVDGALIQLMYRFKGKKLYSHRLAFFPSPFLEDYHNARDSYDFDYLYGDVITETIMPFPIRFDYHHADPAYREMYHSKCHMTLGEFQHCRIPASSPLSPVKFLTFILKHFYFEDKNHLINQGVYLAPDETVDTTISVNEQTASYFSV